MICASIQRLHQLAWQPGKWMHSDWWPYLDLIKWQASYQQYPVCRLAIDRLIIARRQFPQQALPGSLSEEESTIMLLESKLPRLMIALGLIILACQDYLLLGRYRRILATQLGEHGCDQLLALYSGWSSQPASLSEADLVYEATRVGVQKFTEQVNHTVSQALLLVLPPVESAPAIQPVTLVLPTLVKLARFL